MAEKEEELLGEGEEGAEEERPRARDQPLPADDDLMGGAEADGEAEASEQPANAVLLRRPASATPRAAQTKSPAQSPPAKKNAPTTLPAAVKSPPPKFPEQRPPSRVSRRHDQ